MNPSRGYTHPREIADYLLDVQAATMDYLACAEQRGDGNVIAALTLAREDQRHSQRAVEATCPGKRWGRHARAA